MAWLHIFGDISSPSTFTNADREEKRLTQARAVKEIWLVVTAVLSVLILVRLASLLLSVAFRMSHSKTAASANVTSEDGVERGQQRRISWRRLPSSFASAFRIVAFRSTIPIGPSSVSSVAELFFILGYMASMLTLLFIDTSGLESMFWDDRSAVLASCQLPLIVALAGKNNIVSFLTGIGHERLNVLHRAAARTCLLLLWIHAMTHASDGLPDNDLSHSWMQWGVAGLTAFTLATVLSIRPVRQAFFEFFLVSHIFLIAIFLVGGYFHTRQFGYNYFVWPAILIWALDRFLRASRLFWNNRVWLGGSSNPYSNATVELLSPDTIRLTLRRRVSWKAGQHAYIVLPTVSNLPTEAHPFTIASISQSMEGGQGVADKDMVFLIRGRSGFTGRLRNHAARKGTGVVPAYVDGPYGCPPNLNTFSTCVLIAGGSGVSYTLPLLMDVVRNARCGNSSIRKVVFVWLVRDAVHLSWVSTLLDEAISLAPITLRVYPRIHITGNNNEKDQASTVPTIRYGDLPATPSSSWSHREKATDMPIFTRVKAETGRPDVRRLLEEEIMSASGPVSVDVAGPSALAQSVRNALKSDLTSPLNVLRGASCVTLHVETFGMVKG